MLNVYFIMKGIPILLATVCGMALVSASSTNSTVTGSSLPGKRLKLALVSNTGSEYWHLVRAGCNAATKELDNVDVQFHMNQGGDAAGQIQILKGLLAEIPDGVAVSVNNVLAEIDHLDEIAEQTLLVCFDSDASPSKRAWYIGTDNLEAGMKAGNLIKECLPDGGRIMLFVGNTYSQNSMRRRVGIMRALRDSKIEIVDVLIDEADPVRTQNNVQETLTKYPDVDCLVGLWGYEGPAILKAVRRADKIGKVSIVCFDDEPETLAGVASGAIYGTVVQNPFEIGKQTVILMDKYLRGDDAGIGEEKKVLIPAKQIKQDHVAEYEAERKKILSQ